MISYLHNIAYAILPVVVPTPKNKLPKKLTPTEILQARIDGVREDMLQIHLKRAELRGQERQLDILLNEYQLSLEFFRAREIAQP